MVDSAVSSAIPQATSRPQDVREFFRRLFFILVAGFILIAPAMPQVFEVRSVFFRPWTMFSGVGVGLLKGTFTEVKPDGEIVQHDPAHVLGQKHYSRAMVSPFPYHVWTDAHLMPATGPFCAKLPNGTRLTFDGYRQSRGGWVRLLSDDVCGVK